MVITKKITTTEEITIKVKDSIIIISSDNKKEIEKATELIKVAEDQINLNTQAK